MREEGKRGAKWGGPWGSRGGRHVRIAHPLAALLPPCPWREGDACMCAGGGAMLGEGGCCGVLARCCATVVLLLLVSTERPTEIAEFLSPGRGRAPESALLLARCVGEPRPAGRGSVSPGPWPGSLRFLLARAAGELPARWALRSVSAGPGARRVCVMPAQARPARSSSTPAWRTAGCRARIARVTPAALSSPSPSPARPGPQPHLVPA